jgi:2-polyprenyl-3-methyl-5-hydroxy-6-metoxy-1,4-benzoquinol methylase
METEFSSRASERAKIWRVLDNPIVWQTTRILLNATFNLYRARINLMKQLGLLADDPSVIEIGCGIGSYSTITRGPYLGVDVNPRYIEYARRQYQRANQIFRCTDVRALLEEHAKFDLVLMVDFLHHIPDDVCAELLETGSQLANKHVVSFEPITWQPNPVGRWIVEHDRGDHVRSLEKLHRLFEESPLTMTKSVELRLGPINTRAIIARPSKL